jgi:hypothetical protein
MTSSTYRNKKSHSVDTYCTYYTSPILVYHCSTSSSVSMMMIMMVTKIRMMVVVVMKMVIVVMMIIRMTIEGIMLY